MSLSRYSHIEDTGSRYDCQETRSHSAQGLTNNQSSSAMKIPLPPSLWITDIENESSDLSDCENTMVANEKHRVRSRFRHHKSRSVNVPIGIFWDIENCQVPHGCSAIDVVAAIRNKFLVGRREADFVVVCDVRKETPARLQELNDAQVSLIHVCGTQKNAADEKLRQCMRRFGELHAAPASLLLISGDINFAADLSDFRHRKNMEVILVHKQNTSSALIACASSHYCYNKLTADLPRNPKVKGQVEEEPCCEIEVTNLPVDQPPERVSRRLRRLADNCGGKVLKVKASTASLKFPTTDQASRALKRMTGEDVFGRKISVRYLRSAYSSDEGYSTAPAAPPPARVYTPPASAESMGGAWSLALEALPAPPPPPLDFCPPPAPRPRQIRGAHGSANLDQSGCSSASGGSANIRYSPWNSSSFSEPSEPECETTELTVVNLPPYEPTVLQKMLTELLNQYVPVTRVSIWVGGDGPIASVVLRSEWDARIAIAKVHKRRLDNSWSGKRLELSLGRPSPAPNLDVLRARLRAIFLDQKNLTIPLLRLRDAYASRHCCALTTSDLAKVKDTVIVHEKFCRMVQLIDLTPVTEADMEEAPWKCHVHSGLNPGHEDGSRILQPVYVELSVLAANVNNLVDSHGGLLPLLTFVECYEATFPPLRVDPQRGVCLELLLRSISTVEIKDTPSRHLVRVEPEKRVDSPLSGQMSEGGRSGWERGRTAPALEPMLLLFERELIDLLRSAPACCIPFNKVIPAFHRHFGRQCRVADYGFTKLPDLLSALSNTIVVLGSGSSRIIAISASAQSRRWTSDLVKLLSSQPGRAISPHDLPQLYETTFGCPFSPSNYGVCTITELMQKITPQAVVISIDGLISLPRKTPTPEEKERTNQFAAEVIELLGHTPNFRMEFSKFVPAYHAHFGRQLRVAHYGCVKLFELFELIPEAVTISFENRGERCVKLTPKASVTLFTQRLTSLAPLPLTALTWQYAAHYGAPPQPDIMNVPSMEALVISVGFRIENGMIYAPGDSPYRASLALYACSVLSSDRCVAKGSAEDYFISAFKKLDGSAPDLTYLVSLGVVEISERRVILTPIWRTVWRVAQLLVDRPPMTAMEIYVEFTKNYEPFLLSASLGLEGVSDFLRLHRQVFVEEVLGRWALCVGVVVPRFNARQRTEDYSIYDTPPGQKGSRVFESPKNNIWSSPPASSLPLPSALLAQENRRKLDGRANIVKTYVRGKPTANGLYRLKHRLRIGIRRKFIADGHYCPWISVS